MEYVNCIFTLGGTGVFYSRRPDISPLLPGNRAIILVVNSGVLRQRRQMANQSDRTNHKSKRQNNGNGEALLAWHRLHTGVYARVAKRLGVDASYVSRVAKGERQAEHVEKALIYELKRIQRLRPPI